jgi:hypothetical protein
VSSAFASYGRDHSASNVVEKIQQTLAFLAAASSERLET